MLAFTGRVQKSDGATNVAGAKVQIFCAGAGPDCIDPARVPGNDPLPLIEGLTDDQGAFTLRVPNASLTACTPGEDQTCNDDPNVSSTYGRCSDTGTCTCMAGSTLNPDTGRCAR
jgi:hypothetical protein